MGMGGTAIGYVDDPSSIFHNPAGMSGVKGGAVLANFSPIVAAIRSSPSDHAVFAADGTKTKPGQSIWSETGFSPAFLIGSAYRILDRVVLGFSVYPVASSGGQYKYTTNKAKEIVEVTDFTKLVFLDFAPAVAVELMDGLQIGATYRYTTVGFQRKRTNPDPLGSPTNVDLDMKGSNARGFRVGFQWKAKDFSLGGVYRAKTETPVTAATGTLENTPGKDISFAFILPAKFGFGFQYSGIAKLRLAADFEYTQQSDNDTTELKGTGLFGDPAAPAEVKVTIPNISKWNDNFTARVGAGYQLGAVEARLGYILDGAASQPKYASAFGTPPTETHTATLGAGYKVSDALDIGVAMAYRTGSATITAADQTGNGCPFCGKPGEYELQLFGAYLDVCWRFGGATAEVKAAAEPPPAAATAAPAAAPSLEPPPEPAAAPAAPPAAPSAVPPAVPGAEPAPK